MTALGADMEHTRGKGKGNKKVQKKSSSVQGLSELLELVKTNLKEYTNPSVEPVEKNKTSEPTKRPSPEQELGNEATTKGQAAKPVITRGPATALTKYFEAATTILDALKFPEDLGLQDFFDKTLLQQRKDDNIMHAFAIFWRPIKGPRMSCNFRMKSLNSSRLFVKNTRSSPTMPQKENFPFPRMSLQLLSVV